MKLLACSSLLLVTAAFAQAPSAPAASGSKADAKAAAAAAAATGPKVLSTPGPLFTTPQSDLHKPVTIIAYGDMRFTETSNTTATNPFARKALVDQIAKEHPDAVLLSGDVPYRGSFVEDYQVFRTETAVWRDSGLRVYPALGNHEFAKCEPAVCLDNWWNGFPEMPQLRNRRWYSAQLGDAFYFFALDSDTSLLPGSEQMTWIKQQIDALPATVRFVFLSLHHPPVADIQTHEHVDHNPRPNELALRDYLRSIAPKSKARFIVVAGHTHNYERFDQDGVIYFVSGGGGAQPYAVERGSSDLYQNPDWPNYHYIRFTLDGNKLKGEMVRLETYNGPKAEWKTRDKFEISGK